MSKDYLQQLYNVLQIYNFLTKLVWQDILLHHVDEISVYLSIYRCFEYVEKIKQKQRFDEE